MLLNCGVGEDSWEPLGLQGDPTRPSQRRAVLSVHWNDWCWSWNSSTLTIWWQELTHLKRPWCWERLKVGEEGDDRGWDGWMASPTQWTWVWVNSGSWCRTGRPGVLQSMGSQRVRQDWVDWTELNWTELFNYSECANGAKFLCILMVYHMLHEWFSSFGENLTWSFVKGQRIFSYLNALGLLYVLAIHRWLW